MNQHTPSSAPEHSPLPWGTVKETIVDANGNYVNTNFLANRNKIIPAVNAHAELLAAAKAVQSAYNTEVSFPYPPKLTKSIQFLQATIARAEKQS